jgi:hypothetical protein
MDFFKKKILKNVVAAIFFAKGKNTFGGENSSRRGGTQNKKRTHLSAFFIAFSKLIKQQFCRRA